MNFEQDIITRLEGSIGVPLVDYENLSEVDSFGVWNAYITERLLWALEVNPCFRPGVELAGPSQ
jgi:hypothetical protein